jgi:hypothetical protein
MPGLDDHWAYAPGASLEPGAIARADAAGVYTDNAIVGKLPGPDDCIEPAEYPHLINARHPDRPDEPVAVCHDLEIPDGTPFELVFRGGDFCKLVISEAFVRECMDAPDGADRLHGVLAEACGPKVRLRITEAVEG